MDACGAWNEVASPSGRHSALAHARPRPRPPARQPNRRFVAARAVKSPKRLKYSGVGTTAGKEPTVVSIDAANYTPSDAWRLQPAIEALQKGAVRPSC